MDGARSLDIHTLPDAVLTRIFSLLGAGHGVHDRNCRNIALVCRRWRQLADSPELLRNLRVSLRHPSLPRLRSLSEWVVRRAARHVRQLHLRVPTPASAHSYPPSPADQHTLREMSDALVSLLTACGDGLGILVMDIGKIAFTFGSWAAALTSLLRLTTSRSVAVAYTASLAPLTRLLELSLTQGPDLGPVGQTLGLSAEARLPVSLTKLMLSGGDSLPPQVAALTQLQNLEVEFAHISATGYGPLRQLSSLEALMLTLCHAVPDCLSQLTSLKRLQIVGAQAEGQPGALQAALPRLSQLTSLSLSPVPEAQLYSPPPEIASLPLRRFLWASSCLEPAHELLPAGPWLESLRDIGGPIQLLANSLGVLQAATQLECIGAIGVRGEAMFNAALGVVWWSTKYGPTLKRLVLQVRDPSTVPPALTQAVEVAKLQLPGLQVCIGPARFF